LNDLSSRLGLDTTRMRKLDRRSKIWLEVPERTASAQVRPALLFVSPGLAGWLSRPIHPFDQPKRAPEEMKGRNGLDGAKA
jgi:hypothetical protein